MTGPLEARALGGFLEACEERPRDRVGWVERIAATFAAAMGSERGSFFAVGSRVDGRLHRVLASTAEPGLPEALKRSAELPALVARGWPRHARIASWRPFSTSDPELARDMLSTLLPGADDIRGLFVELGALSATLWVPLYDGEADRTLPDRTLLRLQRRLSGALGRDDDFGDSDLIVTEDGAVLHASAESERALAGRVRDVALAFARSAGPRVEGDEDAERLWEELWRGGWTVSESVDEGGSRVVILRRVKPVDPAPTAREWAALRLAADGRALKRIAAELGTCEATASTHLQRGLRKLGLPDRAALVRVFGRPTTNAVETEKR